MKKDFSTFFAFFCFLVLLLCIGASSVSEASCCTIYGKVLRLHVIADSDSENDQTLKYKVRDGLLVLTKDLFYNCKDVTQALDVAKSNQKFLEDAANEVLIKNGCKEKAKVVIGKEEYPEKKYASLTFPKGEYLSVKVVIGSGSGKNWWCVLFPPLCNAGVEDGSQLLSSYGINEEEVRKFQEENSRQGIEIFGCRIKLRIFEFFD